MDAVHANKTEENESRSFAHPFAQKQRDRIPVFQLADNRPEAGAQRELIEMANDSAPVKQFRSFQAMANNSPKARQAVQRQTMANNYSAQKHRFVQKKSQIPAALAGENNTGLPDNLKAGIEKLSGYSMDDVKVHYHSDKPVQLQAHAYTQGTDIHLAPGQEKYMPHEAWHVVQQKQGRVAPTAQLKGVGINDDSGLEKEADIMGARALSLGNRPAAAKTGQREEISGPAPMRPVRQKVTQLSKNAKEFLKKYEPSNEVFTPFFKDYYHDGEKPKNLVTTPGIGVIAAVPTHPKGSSVEAIENAYSGGFHNKEEAGTRFGLAVGLNAYGGLDKEKEGFDSLEESVPKRKMVYPTSLVLFTWAKKWYYFGSEIEPDKEQLLQDLDEMQEGEKKIVRKQERVAKDGKTSTLPYGIFREAIIKASTTDEVRNKLLSREANTSVYYHIADDDVASISPPPTIAKQGKGIYDVYQDEIRRSVLEDSVLPTILAGGYRIRREDNPNDPGDVPSSSLGTQLSEFSSDIDQGIREAIAQIDPRLPYYSEANILVDSKAVYEKMQHETQLTGEIFGKNTFESGNLKRYLGIYATNAASKEARQQSKYIANASLVTGTGGGGDRFLAFNFGKPEKYQELNDELLMKEYRKAISVSQNIGSPGNLAVNISIFFKQKKNWTVPTKEITQRFCQLAESNLSGNKVLLKALTTQLGTKTQLRDKSVAQYPEEHKNGLWQFIDEVILKTIQIHEHYYKAFLNLIKEYAISGSTSTTSKTGSQSMDFSQEIVTDNTSSKRSKDTFPLAEDYSEESGDAVKIPQLSSQPPVTPGNMIVVKGENKMVTRTVSHESYWYIFYQ